MWENKSASIELGTQSEIFYFLTFILLFFNHRISNSKCNFLFSILS